MTIGFKQAGRQEEEEKKEEVIIKDLEKEFSAMIKDLTLEEEILHKAEHIEHQLRVEITKIYKKLVKLEKEFEKNTKAVNKISMYSDVDPEKGIKLAYEVKDSEEVLAKKFNELEKEIAKIIPKELNEVFQEVELSEEKIKDLRSILNIISSRFNLMNNSIQGKLSQRYWDNYIYSETVKLGKNKEK